MRDALTAHRVYRQVLHTPSVAKIYVDSCVRSGAVRMWNEHDASTFHVFLALHGIADDFIAH